MSRKVSYNISFEGEKIEPINYLSINQPLNGHHGFEVRVPIRERSQILTNMSQSYIGKNAEITIMSGLGTGDQQLQFIGIITGVSLSKHHGSANELIYTGHSVTLLMDDGAHFESYSTSTIEKIAKKVLTKFSFPHNPKVKPRFTTELPYFVQYRETAFQYLSRLATIFGEWFYYDGKFLYFGEPANEPEIELLYGRDLLNFDLSLHISPTKSNNIGYDPVTHKYPEVSAAKLKVPGLDQYASIAYKASQDKFTNEPVNVEYYDIKDKSELEEITKHRKNGKSAQMVILSASSDVFTLKLGSIIKLTGQIDTENFDYGKFRIINISHSTDQLGNYKNNFKAISESLIDPPINPYVSNPICEMQPAEVLENHDPEGLGRVRIQFQWQKSTNEKTPWIRVSASGAGGTHGSFFIPEKNDQVFVGFEHDNPNRPYVIGSLYHGKAKPGGGLADKDNNFKVIKTKSGNQIFMGDLGGGQTIKIESGANSIEMTPQKIVIRTDGDLELHAKNITLTASEKIGLVSTGGDISVNTPKNIGLLGETKITIGSKDIESKATAKNATSGMTVEIKGQTKAEIDGGASTEVKGAVIKLN